MTALGQQLADARAALTGGPGEDCAQCVPCVDVVQFLFSTGPVAGVALDVCDCGVLLLTGMGLS